MAGPTFSALTADERDWIAQQLEGARLFVDTMSAQDAGQPITLEALDRAFAAWLQQSGGDSADVNAAINVVGIQFGQLLVDQAGFEWTIASDRHGTDLAVLALPGRGDVLVYPANFVAKRWDRRETYFLVDGFEAIRQQVAAVAAEHDRPERRPRWKFW